MIQNPSLWRQKLRHNFTNWEKLADFLELSDQQRRSILTRSKFPLNLPFRLAEKIEKGTLEDPILKQFLPMQVELEQSPLFIMDPVGDQTSRATPKLLHKYHGRALILASSACAMHCRYCFRQKFDYEVEEKSFVAEIEKIKSDPTIHEVILSGGDPLSLSNQSLDELLKEIAAIPHIKRVRFHTRFLMGIPERIDDSFLEMMAQFPLQIWIVIHANHAKEFDTEIFQSLKKLRQCGVNLLCQSVLLKGINDNEETLVELFELLVNQGVLPYYLHQLDRVQGASHFEVPEEEGKRLIEAISRRLPGFAVPKYVRETSGAPYKLSLL